MPSAGPLVETGAPQPQAMRRVSATRAKGMPGGWELGSRLGSLEGGGSIGSPLARAQ